MMHGTRYSGTTIIGAGQAGLAIGHALAERGEHAVILDAGSRVGDSWRNRWDSLRLFTPAEHDGLPGLAFPAPRGTFPGKDDVAEYLESYARTFDLAPSMDCTVVRLRQDEKGWVIRTTEDTVTAATVVVATGANPRPRIPHFRSPLSADIVQMHSGEYRNPEALPDGDVLVVGAGTSGAQIALELSRTHAVRIAGRPTPHVPDLVLRRAGAAYWFLVDSVLTRDTRVGRKATQGFMTRGAPLISVSMKDLTDAGVTPVGRVVDVVDGGLGLADGPTVHPATVLWATGYRPDFGWIDQLACDPYGWPLQRRGVAQGAPGLFFLGVPFQYALTSALIGGVGRDASYIADRITGGDGC